MWEGQKAMAMLQNVNTTKYTIEQQLIITIQGNNNNQQYVTK